MRVREIDVSEASIPLHRNPWFALPETPPYVLPEDAPFVREFNRRAKKRERIDLRLMPEPFFGHRHAPVVLLLLNPGLGTCDLRHHRNGEFRSSLRKSILAEHGTEHFHLADMSRGPGYKWWQRACRQLINELGVESVANGLQSIEFSPYHSKVFGHAHLRLPSQVFNFRLVQEAMKRGAFVVCMRGLRQWCGAIPELGVYEHLITPANPRASALSPRNLKSYDRLLGAFNGQKREKRCQRQ